MQYKIEKSIELKAPVSRVWRALADHKEFGEWFRVKLDAPFAVGEVSRGHITYLGYEHLKWEAVVKEMEPEQISLSLGTPTLLMLEWTIQRRRLPLLNSRWSQLRMERA